MGQRSQIYVKVNVTDEKGNTKTDLTARYYQWNYGERMISRARSITEWVSEHLNYWTYERDKLPAIMAINFDMGDKVDTLDILKETCEYMGFRKDKIGWEVPTSENKDVFNSSIFDEQDNNNGQFFLEVSYNEKTKEKEMKYAFRELEYPDIPMDAYEYLITDLGYKVEDKLEEAMKSEEWKNPNFYKDFFYNHVSEILSGYDEYWLETISEIHENITFLEENVHTMTKEELQAFLTFDYSKQLQEVRKEAIKEEYGKISGRLLEAKDKEKIDLEKQLKELKEVFDRPVPEITKEAEKEEDDRLLF